MSWYSVGAEAADQVAASMTPRRRRNFFTKPGERATIRFLAPASKSFNYKRAFIRNAPGEKMLTSPETSPDPFVEAGINLQVAAAWWVIDRRKLEVKDRETGETKEIGPRILYFADGTRTRKQLVAFEKDQLVNQNEERAEDGQDALDLQGFNLTSYDITCSKDSKAPWNFSAKRPKPLSKVDHELIEKTLGCTFEDLQGDKAIELLATELEPLAEAELRRILKVETANGNGDGETQEATYSYGDDNEDTISFDD